MYRIILILLLLIALYFLLRSAIRELKERNSGSRPVLDKNQMVQDPFCRVFVPRGSATAEEIGGQTYYFCSRTCANSFQKQLAGQQPE